MTQREVNIGLTLNGVEEFALLDTDCEVSLANNKCTINLEVENFGVRLVTASHTNIDVQGEVVLPFKLGELDLPTPPFGLTVLAK